MNDWMDGAACCGVDTDTFFPEEPEDEAALAAARVYCDGCVARDACLEYALANRIKEGIWGGLSEKQRRRVLRQRRKERAVA